MGSGLTFGHLSTILPACPVNPASIILVPSTMSSFVAMPGWIFFDDRDRYRLYLIIQYAVEKFRCRIHAFCLMRNHIHLVMQVDDIPLSRIMRTYPAVHKVDQLFAIPRKRKGSALDTRQCLQSRADPFMITEQDQV